jgi:hypothetical protein
MLDCNSNGHYAFSLQRNVYGVIVNLIIVKLKRNC